jgi:hypothetical protein
MTLPLRQRPLLLFAALASLIYAAEILVASRLPSLRHPGLVAAAVAFDLLVFVPLLYAGLVLRRDRQWIRLAPVVLLSLTGASLVLPPAYRSYLPPAHLLAVPLELALVVYVARRAVRLRRRSVSEGREGPDGLDTLERLRSTLSQVLPWPRIGELMADELATLYYGLFAWRTSPPQPSSPGVFSYHRKAGYGAVVTGLILACAFEAAGVHLLVTRWSPGAAWVLTVLSLYGAIWLVADARAMRFRPLALQDSHLLVRIGLRWTVRIPLATVAEVRHLGRQAVPRRAPGYLHAAVLLPPQILLVLRESVVAHGPYGIRRVIGQVGLAVDEPERLREALAQARAGS